MSIHSLAPALPATFSGSTVRVSIQVRRLSAEAPTAVQLALEIRSPNDGVVYDSTSRGENQIVDISGGGIHERYFDWPSSSGSATGAYSTLASVRNSSEWDDVCGATWSGAWGGGYPRQAFQMTTPVALLTPTPSPLPGDDHGDSVSSATSISVDRSYSGNVETGGDIDFFAFPAQSGIPYVVETSLGSLVDSHLTLYDSSGSTLDSNDDWIDLASQIQWTAPSSGTYYAAVRAYDSSMTGSYGLSVSEETQIIVLPGMGNHVFVSNVACTDYDAYFILDAEYPSSYPTMEYVGAWIRLPGGFEIANMIPIGQPGQAWDDRLAEAIAMDIAGHFIPGLGTLRVLAELTAEALSGDTGPVQDLKTGWYGGSPGQLQRYLVHATADSPVIDFWPVEVLAQWQQSPNETISTNAAVLPIFGLCRGS